MDLNRKKIPDQSRWWIAEQGKENIKRMFGSYVLLYVCDHTYIHTNIHTHIIRYVTYYMFEGRGHRSKLFLITNLIA